MKLFQFQPLILPQKIDRNRPKNLHSRFPTLRFTWAYFPQKTKDIWRQQFSKVYAEVEFLCHDQTDLSHWKTITQPTCITIAEHSPPTEREVCLLLAQTLANCTLVEHSGDHLAPLTHIAEVAPIISRWLQR